MIEEEYRLFVDMWEEMKTANAITQDGVNELVNIRRELGRIARGLQGKCEDEECAQCDEAPIDVPSGLGRPFPEHIPTQRDEEEYAELGWTTVHDPMEAVEVVGADAEGDGGEEL
jgi:hypothetical protein